MSIVALQKVTAFGHLDDKASVLEDLQAIGCIHLERLTKSTDGDRQLPVPTGVSQESRDALRHLNDCPVQRHRFRPDKSFDAHEIQRRTLDNQRRLQDLRDERDFLVERIASVRPWGVFSYPHLDEMNGLRLWFYLVPHHLVGKVRDTGFDWEIVHQDNRFCYLVVVAESEPANMPVERTLIGEKSLSALEKRLDEIDHALDEEQAERESLTRWIDVFERHLAEIEATENRQKASLWTLDNDPVFAIQGWIPKSEAPRIREYARNKRMAVQIEDPAPGESPPTLLKNNARFAVGQDLVTFYMSPAYHLWDPSMVVLFSFTTFFAMILSDAGYGLVMVLGLLVFRRKLGASVSGRRVRVLLRLLALATVVWGVLVGSYFGIVPGEGSFLARFHLVDMSDMSSMMTLSILIGAAHVILANVMDASRRFPSQSAFAPTGWIIAILGALGLFFGNAQGAHPWFSTGGTIALIAGLSFVLLFAGADSATFGTKLTKGLLSVAKLTNAFGDILSYLRLFALGLASASLAVAFNDLAYDAQQSMGGFGILVAFIILLVGHTLNFVLSLVSGFVHGLRLNLIEFFNWGIPDEGIPFRPFSRRDNPPSVPGSIAHPDVSLSPHSPA